MRRLVTGIAAGVAALVVALPASAAAKTMTLKTGTVAGAHWKLTARASSISTGSSRLPSLCMSFLFVGTGGSNSAGPSIGSSATPGNGPTWCIAPARGSTPAGPPWVFDPAISPYDGLAPPGVTITVGVARSILFFADPRARWVVASLADGERLRIPARPVAGALRRPATFALSVTGHPSSSPSARKVLRAVAYDAHGHVVGRMSPRAPRQPFFLYS